MQASFELFAFKVRTSKPEYCLVIPPDETADGSLEKVRYSNEGPEFASTINVLRCELCERRNVAVLRPSADNIDGDQNAAADSAENDEDVSNHPLKPEEKDGVQANRIHKVLLLRLCDGLDPIERTLFQGQRLVLFVGMFRSWRIDAVVSWAQEAEDEEEETGDDERVDDSGVYGTLLDLRVLD